MPFVTFAQRIFHLAESHLAPQPRKPMTLLESLREHGLFPPEGAKPSALMIRPYTAIILKSGIDKPS